VVLDLGGHTITGTNREFDFDTVGIMYDSGLGEIERPDFTIRNGTVSGFSSGIFLFSAGQVRLENVRVSMPVGSTGYGIRSMDSGRVDLDNCDIIAVRSPSENHLLSLEGDGGGTIVGSSLKHGHVAISSNTTIENSQVEDSTLFADGANVSITRSSFSQSFISLDESRDARVEDNEIRDERPFPGISIGRDVTDATIARNEIEGNEVGLGYSYPGSTRTGIKILGNRFVGNGRAGLVLDDMDPTHVEGTVIEGNTFIANGHGPTDSQDSSGHPYNNGLHLNLTSGASVMVRNNRTENNAVYGIYATPGSVIDGGGNTSSGDPMGCLGVTCS